MTGGLPPFFHLGIEKKRNVEFSSPMEDPLSAPLRARAPSPRNGSPRAEALETGEKLLRSRWKFLSGERSFSKPLPRCPRVASTPVRRERRRSGERGDHAGHPEEAYNSALFNE